MLLMSQTIERLTHGKGKISTVDNPQTRIHAPVNGLNMTLTLPLEEMKV